MLCYLSFFFDSWLTWSHHVDIMCNRVRASIKALQLLGNSVHGLDHTSWRFAYNTICLLVLTYGCQLWFQGKQVTLVKKLQMVQNEAVKVISGTFCTTPCKPLHQLLSVLPMDLRLTMLTQNTTLWLYRVSKESQLLTCLSGNWYALQPQTLLLPTPNNTNVCMTLWSLAARASPKGPHIDNFPKLPLDAPNCNGRVKWIPRQTDWEYLQAAKALTNLCKEGKVITIFSKGIISNHLRKDKKQVRTTLAILYQHSQEWKHKDQALG